MKAKAILILLKLCGASADWATSISGVEPTLRHASALNWFIPLALAVGALAWWSYRRDTVETISPMHRHMLSALRIALLSLLLLLPLQPVLSFTVGATARNAPALGPSAEPGGHAPADEVSSKVDAELWASPVFFLLIAFVSSTEWALRKRWQLR